MSLAAAQIAGLRSMAAGLACLMLAISLLLVALVFVLLSGFWALSAILPLWQAALAMAAAALVLALMIRTCGNYLIRRRAPAWRLTGQPAAAQADGLPVKKSVSGIADPLLLTSIAAVVGIVMGRRLSR